MYEFELHSKNSFQKVTRIIFVSTICINSVFDNIFVSVNNATIIPNDSIYYMNGDRNIIKKIGSHTYIWSSRSNAWTGVMILWQNYTSLWLHK